MRDLYIGGPRRAKKGGFMWKLVLFFSFLLIIVGAALKVSAPFIVERWLNESGSGHSGYAYSVRDVELSLKDGEMILSDVKVFNPKTHARVVESPSLKLQMNLTELIRTSDRKIKISADKVDIFISTDLTAEIKRIANSTDTKDLYFNLIEAKFTEFNVIERKTDESRRLVTFQDVNLDMKDISVVSVNENTEFTLTSKLADGGELNLSANMNEEKEQSFWMIQGYLKEFSPELFNKLAGTELPFSFNESTLNADVVAYTNEGKIKGEIIPEVKRLNLIDERPGGARQVIARALTDELTFTLPFTLKDELEVQYADTFKKLKEYRKYPQSVVSSRN